MCKCPISSLSLVGHLFLDPAKGILVNLDWIFGNVCHHKYKHKKEQRAREVDSETRHQTTSV